MRKSQKSKYDPINRDKYVGDVSNIVCRSSWERGVCKWLDRNTDVVAWSSETVVIPYFLEEDKQIHRYFIDFVVRYKSGKVVLVEVKPLYQTQPPKATQGKRKEVLLEEMLTHQRNISKWEAALKFCEKNGMTFQIWTEPVLRALGIPV